MLLRHPLRLLLCLAICGLICRCASAVGKITEDPNAGPAIPTAEIGKADPRLAQKVTYEAWHTPVKTILTDLSEKAGVTLFSGYNKNDWQVRDRKMNIFVKDVSLAQLMNSIARVMKFKWFINNEKDPLTYRLHTDRRLLAKLQAEASNRENEFKREEMKRRTGLVGALAKVANASGAELQTLRESNPYLYICAETGFAKLVTQMFSEEPRFKEIFIKADKNLIPRMEVLSPDTQQLCADVMRKVWPLEAVHRERQHLPNDLEQIIQNYSVHMRLIPRPFEWNFRVQLQDFGFITTNISTGDHAIGWLKDPNAKSTQAWARSHLTALDRGIDHGNYNKAFGPEVDTAENDDAKEIEYYFMFDPVAEHPDEPDMQRKIWLKVTNEIKRFREEQLKASGGQAKERIDYQTNLRLISDAAVLNIVSDSFAVVVGEFNPASLEEELQKVLGALADGYICNWDKHGSVLEINRRDWFRRRSCQIPDEWIEPWREELKRTGTVTLDTYCQMAILSDEQIEENINSDPMLGKVIGEWWSYGNNKGFARFYQQLTADQRGLIFTEQGLDPNMLSHTQRPYYVEMFHYGGRHAWDTEQFSDPGSSQVTINGMRKLRTDGSCWGYSFVVKLNKGDGSVAQTDWSFPLPLIARPQLETEVKSSSK